MFNLKSNLNNLSRIHLTYISIIAILVFLGVARLSYAAITIGLTTVTSDGSLSAVSTGDFIFSTTVSNGDTLKLVPATGGAGTFAGTLTSSDLTANRTWTFPNESGTIALTGGGVSAADVTSGTFSFALISSATPKFLAYNSASDTVSNGDTIDFDTEVYDNLGNFANDVFTAPVTGTYHFCVTVESQSNGLAAGLGLDLVTSNRSYRLSEVYQFDYSVEPAVPSFCTDADMDASDTAHVIALSIGGNASITGGGSPYSTFFSGRLVP